MNNQAKTAYDQYKDLAKAWQVVNPDMADNSVKLIEWIEDKRTGTTQDVRQDVQEVNWESCLSGFPSDVLQIELTRRYKEMID
jgi:hypothetical protein